MVIFLSATSSKVKEKHFRCQKLTERMSPEAQCWQQLLQQGITDNVTENILGRNAHSWYMIFK